MTIDFTFSHYDTESGEESVWSVEAAVYFESGEIIDGRRATEDSVDVDIIRASLSSGPWFPFPFTGSLLSECEREAIKAAEEIIA